MLRIRHGSLIPCHWLCAGALALAGAGCGLDPVQTTPANQVQGFSLADLQDIQNDERLTDAEKTERIREAMQAPNNDSGDRLAAFLLTVNVP